jgi:hypothetical protein
MVTSSLVPSMRANMRSRSHSVGFPSEVGFTGSSFPAPGFQRLFIAKFGFDGDNKRRRKSGYGIIFLLLQIIEERFEIEFPEQSQVFNDLERIIIGHRLA